MTTSSPRMQWPVPSEGQDPWYQAFVSMLNAIDASAFASREDRNLILAGGGSVSWNATTGVLTWSAPLRLLSASTGFFNELPAGTAVLQNGQILYGSVTRLPGGNVSMSPQVAGAVPGSDSLVALCIRIGSKLYWRNGLAQEHAETLTDIGSKQGGAVTLAGDVTGPSGSNSLSAIRGTPVDATLTPAANDVLKWDGAKWVAGAVPGGGGGGSGGGALIYRPGGPPGPPHVHTTWASLYAAMGSWDGDRVVLVDASFNGGFADVDPSGAPYDLTGWVFRGFNRQQPTTLRFLAPNQLSAPYTHNVFVFEDIDISASGLISGQTVLQLNDAGATFWMRRAELFGPVAPGAAFAKVTGTIQPQLVFVLEDGVVLSGRVAETSGLSAIVVVFHNAHMSSVSPTSFSQPGPGSGMLQYFYVGSAPAQFTPQVGFTDPIAVTRRNDLRYFDRIIKDVAVTATQTGTSELLVGSVYLMAGTMVNGNTRALMGGSTTGHTAILRIRRFTGGALMATITRLGTVADVTLGVDGTGPFTAPASDWYELFLAAGGASQTALLNGVRLVLVPSLTDGV